MLLEIAEPRERFLAELAMVGAAAGTTTQPLAVVVIVVIVVVTTVVVIMLLMVFRGRLATTFLAAGRRMSPDATGPAMVQMMHMPRVQLMMRVMVSVLLFTGGARIERGWPIVWLGYRVGRCHAVRNRGRKAGRSVGRV